ncbi:[tau protein] kinase [Trifolium repens]|nr:[tau protein] kinase [Trifolium repens]
MKFYNLPKPRTYPMKPGEISSLEMVLIDEKLMMSSGGVALASGFIDKNARSVGVEKLPEELNDMKIRDDKKMEASTLQLHMNDGDEIDAIFYDPSHIRLKVSPNFKGKNENEIFFIVRRSNQLKKPMDVYCLLQAEQTPDEVLQYKRYKNRELQTMPFSLIDGIMW